MSSAPSSYARAVLVTLALAGGAAQAAPTNPAPDPAKNITGIIEAAQIPPRALTLLGAIDVPLTAELMAHAGLTPEVAAAVLVQPGLQRYLRLRALWALSQHRSPEARARVIAAADTDTDAEVRVEAALVLARAFAAHGDLVAGEALDRLAAADVGKVSAMARSERQRLDARAAQPGAAQPAPVRPATQVAH